MVVNFFPAPGEFPGIYRVLYVNKAGQDCIADQNNIALLKRWFLDIHHVIDLKNSKSIKSHVKKESRRQPILRFRYPVIWCNNITELPYERLKIFWKFYTKVYTTSYDLADVHQAEQWEIVRSFGRLDSLNEEIRRLNQENNELRTQIETGITRVSVELVADIHQGDPITQYMNEKEIRKKKSAAAAEKEAAAKKKDEEVKDNENKE